MDSSSGWVVRVTDLANDVEPIPVLGRPIIRAYPHPSSVDPFHPVLCRFILSYSNRPDKSLVICYGNGPLEKLLAHEGFQKHINEHVRFFANQITSSSAISDWQFTEYTLGPDGKGSVIDGRDEKNLSPLVRQTVAASRAAFNSRSTNSTSFTTTFRNIGDNVITPEIQTNLFGEYEKYGVPVFRRISDVNNPGASQIKMNFSKISSNELQVAIDFSCDGGEDDEDGPGAVEEEMLLKEVKRQVMGVLLGEKERFKPSKREREPAKDTSDGEEVDQDMEAVAIRNRYWSCHRGEDDGITKTTNESEEKDEKGAGGCAPELSTTRTKMSITWKV